jgi:hypothetical protein
VRHSCSCAVNSRIRANPASGSSTWEKDPLRSMNSSRILGVYRLNSRYRGVNTPAALLVIGLSSPVAVLRRTSPRPRLDWVDRVILAALIRLPGGCERTGWSPLAPSCGGTAAWSRATGPARTGPDGRRSAPRSPP